jgi:hypothetical protein
MDHGSPSGHRESEIFGARRPLDRSTRPGSPSLVSSASTLIALAAPAGPAGATWTVKPKSMACGAEVDRDTLQVYNAMINRHYRLI